MRISNHFKERLTERTGYNVETFYNDLNNRRDEIIELKNSSEELNWYPFLKDSFDKCANVLLKTLPNLLIFIF